MYSLREYLGSIRGPLSADRPIDSLWGGIHYFAPSGCRMDFFAYLCSMKRILSILYIALATNSLSIAQAVSDSAWRPYVKTVLLHPEGTSLSPPLLTLGGTNRLELSFDLLLDQPPELAYTLRHCDAFWRPDSLEPYEFLTGFHSAPITDYQFSFTTLRPYIHYSHSIPEPYAQFSHSGNYLLTVHLAGNPDSILLSRRFRVSEQCVSLSGETSLPYDGIGITSRQEVDAYVETGSWPGGATYLTLVAEQNGRSDNRRTLVFSGYDRGRLTYRHRPPNVFDGGNNFRFFDASNLHTPMYNIVRIEPYGGEYYAILRPEEDRSRKHYVVETTLGGGMKVNAWDRHNSTLEAEYVWVNFSLPMAQPFLDGSVHIVGALTDWRLDTLSRMDYNPQYRAYTKRLLLKQGYYAYQLLLLPAGKSEGVTSRLEGNHRETPNQYTLNLYGRLPSDRADRLLAVTVIQAP